MSYFGNKKFRSKKGGFVVLTNILTNNTYAHKGLKLNIKEGTLQYRNGRVVGVELDSKPIKLLILLLKNLGDIVTYQAISKELDIGSYVEKRDNQGGKTNHLSEAIKYIKRELVNMLMNTGIDRSKITNMLISKRNYGYKLLK